MTFFKSVMTAVFACALALGPMVGTAHATQARSQTDAAELKYKINIAGRQRMLSQRMARQICAAETGIDVAANRDAARVTAETFGDVLTMLRAGGGARDLKPETDPDVLDSLTQVVWLWQPYKTAMVDLADDMITGDLDKIRQLNSGVLKAMNGAVGAMEAAAGGQMDADLARTINVAGRQRMLIERTMMWTCLHATGTDAAADAEQLRAAADLFASSLAALRMGEEGLVPPPMWELEAQLELVEELWSGMSPLIDAATNGTPAQAHDLEQMFVQGVILVEAMNDAVWMYENF